LKIYGKKCKERKLTLYSGKNLGILFCAGARRASGKAYNAQSQNIGKANN
jgi:hypothetical protein